MKQNPGTGQYETNPNNASLQEKSLKITSNICMKFDCPPPKKGYHLATPPVARKLPGSITRDPNFLALEDDTSFAHGIKNPCWPMVWI